MREIRVPVWLWVILMGAAGGALTDLMQRLPAAWRVFVLLCMALQYLVSITGSNGFKSYATAGPATLAGPIQPWQAAVPTAPSRRIGDGIHLLTGIWNPTLVRPLLDDTEEDTHG